MTDDEDGDDERSPEVREAIDELATVADDQPDAEAEDAEGEAGDGEGDDAVSADVETQTVTGESAADAGARPETDATATSDGTDAENQASDTDTEGRASGGDDPRPAGDAERGSSDVPPDVRKYDRFKKIEGGTYDRANDFLRERTYITAREWAIARLCADFRTETGVEMTKIGENLPELVPFMTDTYTPQAVNQARAAFEEKVRKSGATFLYGAMCDFFTAEELDDVMYESTEVAKFLLEVEGVELSVEEELDAEDRISEVMREVRQESAALRHDEVCCPECGEEFAVDDAGEHSSSTGNSGEHSSGDPDADQTV